MCFSAVFSLSHRSEIRSRQISPVEKKEAEAGPESRSLPKVTQEERPYPERKEKGVRVGLPSTVTISKRGGHTCRDCIIFASG